MITGKSVRDLFTLKERGIHVWAVRLCSSDSVVDRLRKLLSTGELTRIARLRFEHLQRSFILTRGTLRTLLGCYLDIDPRTINFAYGKNGKPFVQLAANVQFNTSHSGDFAIFAFTTGCEIGIDIEEIRPLPDLPTIANQFFCSEEASQLASIPMHLRDRAFFLCWTRKEAYLKATGDGFTASLDGFRVTLDPLQPARLVHIDHDQLKAKAWSLQDASLSDRYVGALAYRDQVRPARFNPPTDPAEVMKIADRLVYENRLCCSA